MAKVGCLCGARLSDVNCPSDDIIYIYRYHELEAVIKQNADITLWNFYESTMGEHLYWRCNKCGRVYKFPDGAEASPDEIYRRDDFTGDVNTNDLDELMVFSDVEIDTITEDDPDISLKEFIGNRQIYESYYLDELNGCVYVLDKEKCKVTAKYNNEK